LNIFYPKLSTSIKEPIAIVVSNDILRRSQYKGILIYDIEKIENPNGNLNLIQIKNNRLVDLAECLFENKNKTKINENDYRVVFHFKDLSPETFFVGKENFEIVIKNNKDLFHEKSFLFDYIKWVNTY